MSNVLEGKTAVVTGGSKGIGAGIAKGLAAAGASVVVNYASSAAGADAVVCEIVSAGGRAWSVQGDVSTSEDVVRIFSEVARRHDRLDILVNNAGIYKATPIEDVTPEDFRQVFEVNVLGLLLTTQAALPLFGASGGSIINISALAGQLAWPGVSVYGGTKGAIDAITRSLSKELGARQIRVNAISPGAVETEGLSGGGFFSDSMKARILGSTPLGRFGRPEDIANAAVFLASDASCWIDGQIIQAAGGLT